MRNIQKLFWIAALLAMGCGIFVKKDKSVTPVKVNGEPMLLGDFSRGDLERFLSIFHDNIVSYKPGPEVIRAFSEINQPVQVKIFLGTWCSDTKREVPRFLKILDESRTQLVRYDFFGMNRTKMDPKGNWKKYNIINLPTFIFYRDGKEFGRFIESPKGKSTDEDFIQILQSISQK
jgi:thiol-disulfide isomerase/thioredoxin